MASTRYGTDLLATRCPIKGRSPPAPLAGRGASVDGCTLRLGHAFLVFLLVAHEGGVLLASLLGLRRDQLRLLAAHAGQLAGATAGRHELLQLTHGGGHLTHGGQTGKAEQIAKTQAGQAGEAAQEVRQSGQLSPGG